MSSKSQPSFPKKYLSNGKQDKRVLFISTHLLPKDINKGKMTGWNYTNPSEVVLARDCHQGDMMMVFICLDNPFLQGPELQLSQHFANERSHILSIALTFEKV